MMSKKECLRKQFLIKRKQIKNKKNKEQMICNKVLNNFIVKKSQNILIYLSKEIEVDTFSLIKELIKLDKNIYVPKIENEKMEFYKFTSFHDLKLGKFNILEPVKKIKFTSYEDCCIIVPGLLFDKYNNRLGYGKGYYDYFLNKHNLYKIGLCFQEFIIDRLECEEHDIKMDIVITEE